MLVLVAAILSAMSVAGAVTLPTLPIIGGGGGNGLNDLAALGQGVGQTPARAPTVYRAEPPLVATPLAPCGPGSRPEPGVDGRVRVLPRRQDLLRHGHGSAFDHGHRRH